MLQDISLAVKVNKKQVDQLIKSVGNIEKQVARLNKTKVRLDTSPAQRSVQALEDTLKRAEKVTKRFFGANEIRSGIGAFSKSIRVIREEVSDLRTSFNETKNDIDRINDATTILVGQFKALSLEGRAFAKGGANLFDQKGFTDLKARLEPLKKLPDSLAGTDQALNEINFLLRLATKDSKEFKQLVEAQNDALLRQKRIREQIAFQTEVQRRAQSVMPADPFGAKVPLLPAAGQTSGTFTIESQNRGALQASVDAASGRVISEKKITAERKEQDRLSKKTNDRDRREARRRLRNIRRIRDRRQGAMLGAGFPLLFGGGPGSIAGSLIGTAMAPKGQEFGAQILGSAVGQVIENLILRVSTLADAVKDISFEDLEQSGVRVEKQIAVQISMMKEMGRLEQARAALNEEVSRKVGVLPGAVQDVDQATRILKNTWGEFVSVIGTTMGMLAAPFMALLGNILASASQLLRIVNMIFSSVGALLKLAVTGVGDFLKKIPVIKEIVGLIEEAFNSVAKATGVAASELAEYRLEASKALKEEQALARVAESKSLGLTLKDRLRDLATDRAEAIRLAMKEFNKKMREMDAKGVSQQDPARLTQAAALSARVRRIEAEFKLQERGMIRQGRIGALQGRADVQLTRDKVAERAIQLQAQVLKLGRTEIEQVEIELQAQEEIYKLKRFQLDSDLEKKLLAATELDDQQRILDLHYLAVKSLDNEFITQKAVTEEKRRQLDIQDRINAITREAQFSGQQGRFDVQLMRTQGAMDPAYMGVFGGSALEERIQGMEMLNELERRNNEIRIERERVSAGTATQADVEHLVALRDQYQQLQTTQNKATLEQMRFNEALQLTQPVVDSVFQSLMAVADGTKTAQQAFADFLQSIADMLADVAKQMIAQYIAIGVARQFAGIPTGGGGESNAQFMERTGGLDLVGNAYKGMAKGGSVSANTPYLVGEKGPELFVPGAQGNIVPNNAMGGANVVVNVDASGSNVEGNADQANQLGKAIGLAVQQELIKQKRPGGLLAGV